MEKKHVNAEVVCWRYIYILEVDNRGSKSRFFGRRKIYYTGITDNLVRRFKEHLMNVNSYFLSKNFRNARKKIVFVKHFYGDEYGAMGEELRIKHMNIDRKKKLIESEENVLLSYIPLKCMILKNQEDTGEMVLKMYS